MPLWNSGHAVKSAEAPPPAGNVWDTAKLRETVMHGKPVRHADKTKYGRCVDGNLNSR